ncbi:MAG: NAD(P)H-dependent oxidoreductase [Deltaproteobacteria bacterium]|jgi:multimeric flavodoxin WrbA/putative sterol carrier protein|nr:NAD(P)H-dependent oxidoreductase [Deltaproteobacteria bacterium]
MKVLALNSSPRKEGQSKTEMMLTHLVNGMQAAGAEVETVHLRDKTIRYCAGCFSCWTKTPGICIHKDDMTKELFPKWLEADLVVYASPLYHFHMNAAMKTFIERTLPVLEPFLIEDGDRTFHPLRGKHPLAVFLSVAAFPEEEIFSQLSAWVQFVYGRHGAVAAEIYRSAAETMVNLPYRAIAEDIFAATAQAGREIVESGQVQPETMKRIKQVVVEDKSMLHRMGNLVWKTCIDEGVTPKEFSEKGMIPRPDSIESFMLISCIGFNAEKAGDTQATLQFKFNGDVQGVCHFNIAGGKIEAHAGGAENASLTINTPFELWMDIMAGKADGQQMFMEQKYTVDGDANLLLRMNDFFGRS